LVIVSFTEIPREEWVFCSKRHRIGFRIPMMYVKCLENPEHGTWLCLSCNRPLFRALTEGVKLYKVREELLGKLDEVNEAIRYLEGGGND